MKESIKNELLTIISKATELSVLIGESKFPADYYNYIHSLTHQCEVELNNLVETVGKDLAAGKVAGSNTTE